MVSIINKRATRRSYPFHSIPPSQPLHLNPSISTPPSQPLHLNPSISTPPSQSLHLKYDMERGTRSGRTYSSWVVAQVLENQPDSSPLRVSSSFHLADALQEAEWRCNIEVVGGMLGSENDDGELLPAPVASQVASAAASPAASPAAAPSPAAGCSSPPPQEATSLASAGKPTNGHAPEIGFQQPQA
ncbi:hypothetical protein K435DRAFT_878996, partial [Dendrothele bispora CBS 962.96]